MAHKLRNLQLNRVDSCPVGANPGAHIVLMKRADTKEEKVPDLKKKEDKKEEEPTLESLGKKVEELTKTVETQTKAIEAKDKEIESLKKKEDKKDEKSQEEIDAEVMKSLPEPVRKRLEAQDAEIKKANEAAAKASEEARIAKEAREKTEAIEKAKKEIPNLPGEDEEKGKVLQVLNSKLTKEEVESVMKLFKAGDKALHTLMTSTGYDHADLGGDGSEEGIRKSEGAKGEIEEKAAEIRKSNPKLTDAQAFTKACNENPSLYQKMRAEEKKARRNAERQ